MPFPLRPSRRRFLRGTAALAATLTSQKTLALTSTDPSLESIRLHFGQPAATWPDALPVGNGRLGAMVFGNPALDHIQLNEESIWAGQPGLNRDNPRAAAAVPRIRELLFAGRIAEAEQMAASDMLSVPQRMPAYQTLGDLYLDFSPMGLTPAANLEDYSLTLDLDTAIAITSFIVSGTRYRREIFVSAPDQTIVVRLTASEPNKLSFGIRLSRPGHTPFTIAADTQSSTLATLALTGQALPVNDNPGLPDKEPKTGVRFHALLSVKCEGGTVRHVKADDKEPFPSLAVAKASAVTLLIDCATSYRYPSSATGPIRLVEGDLAAMTSAVQRSIATAARHPYQQLRARHITDYQRLSRRATFSLDSDPNVAIPTDQRMRAVKADIEDPHLFPIYFQYGRYLFISSSRPGTLAANLQGIWNESVDPPWGSKYTVNINAQMNYWLADRANLSDCHTPLFDLLDSTRVAGARVAQSYYRSRGTVVHHNTDLWGDSSPIDGLGGGIWAMGSAWLSLSLADHFDFTGDIAFLRTRAYPTLRENTRFLLDYLTIAPPGTPYAGKLVTGPSCSPENKYKLPDGKSHNLCMGPTMDLAITRAVLSRFSEASTLLDKPDAELFARASDALTQLPPYRIMRDGRLAEWPEDFADQEPGHRHISHLFGLYPAAQITPARTPDLARAARATLDARLAAGSGSTGWSRAWIINCMARLGDGEAAYHNLVELLRLCTRTNLFDVCGLKANAPFQIDGNLGAPAAIAEMLLQSHESDPMTGQRILRLLPALPKAWPTGVVRGLRARGAIECDLTWSAGRANTATLRTERTTTLQLVPPPGQQVATLRFNGRSNPITPSSQGVVLLNALAGKTYRLTFL